MGIMIYRDKESANAAAVTLLAAQMIEKPNCVLGLTASSMAADIFRLLSGMTTAGVLDWGEIKIFNTSEFVGQEAGSLGICGAYLKKNLYDRIGIDMSRVRAPRHYSKDLQAACTEYESELIEAGGMDMLMLVLGRNGHIAYNSPAREFSAFTHVELLPPDTVEESSRLVNLGLNDLNHTQAITLGMSEIMSAKRIILLAFGSEVANAAERMLSSSITPAVPATLLQLHPSVTYILDEAGAIAL